MMKTENTSQDLQAVCQQTHNIEKEYINSMLHATCSDVLKQDKSPDKDDNSKSDNTSDIECKVVSISGLNLALPLAKVKGILKQKEIFLDIEKFLKTGVYIGTVNDNDDVIEVVDLTYLIMNNINDIDYLDKYGGKRVDIALLEGSPMGIIFDKEVAIQKISPEQVCWRNETSDRIWLAGTVKKKGFSLLDTDGILNLLNNKG